MNITIDSGKAVAPSVFTKEAFKAAIHDAGFFNDGNIHKDLDWRSEMQPSLWCNVKKIILFDDPDSVSLVDSKVWRDNQSGTAFMEQGPNAEARAREHAATHKRCNTCSELFRTNSYCATCADSREQQRFSRLKVVAYDEQPCVIGDSWFFDVESLREHLIEHDILPENAEIEEAEPHALTEIEIDHWHDELPEDYDEHYLHPEITAALNALNAAIREHGQRVSFHRSGCRITLPTDFLSD